MGLDSVELVMELEEHFGVTIPDDRAERSRTVADLAMTVSSLLEAVGKPWPACASSVDQRAVLRRVRILTARCLGHSWRNVRPESDLARELGAD